MRKVFEERHSEVFSQMNEASRALLDDRFANAILYFTKAVENIKQYGLEVNNLVSPFASYQYFLGFVHLC